MPVNPNIALAVKPIELVNPLNAYAQVEQLRNAQQQNALAQYQLGAAQRAEAKDIARTNALAQAGNDDTAIANALLKAGDLKGYSEFVKTRRETMKADTELADAKLKQSRSFLDTIDPNDPNAPQQYLAWHQANHADPVLGPLLKARGITAEQSMGRINDAIAKGPQAFAQLLAQSKLGTEKFMELNKPTTQVVDQSGQRQIIQLPGLGGAPTTVGTYADVPLPANVEAQKSRIAAASRAPVQPVAPTITQIVDPENPNRMITIDARRYTGGTLGSPGVLGVGGKEPGAAVRENKAEAGKTQLADDLDNLRASFAELDRLRAIPSTERNPLSNVASSVAASRAGQLAGQAFATEAQVERDVINSARSRLVNSIKNATGMSAQQLNSNVELQTMLKSISDPGQSYQSAMRIIDDIENAYVKGAGMPKKKPPAAGGAPAAGGPNIDELLQKYK